MENILDKITRKAFFLEFETLDVPNSQEICDAILSYAKKSGSEITFISTEMQIKFRLDNVLYTTMRGTSRGGPTVRCVEEK